MPIPQVYIEIFSNNSSTFGPSTCKAVIHDALNVGWGWYSRFPGQMFFTLRQDSIHNSRLTPGLDHVRVWFYDQAASYGPILVFNGRLYDPNESGEDVVWTAWSYLAELSLSLSGFRRMYPSATLGTGIARHEWDDNTADWPLYGAKVKTSSLSNHIATGTFEDPVDGSAVAITTDVRFGVVKVPRLLLMFDLSEIGRANTTNNVVYEISRSITPTFNFWKNRGSAYTAQRLTYPGNVKDFKHVPGVRDVRNVLATVGTTLTGQATAIEAAVTTGTYGSVAFGRREDVISIKTLAGVQADSEFSAQTQITQRAVNESTQLTDGVALDVRSNLFLPFNGWDIEDTIKVQLVRGRTNIDAMYRIVGVRGRMDHTGFHQQIFVQPPTA